MWPVSHGTLRHSMFRNEVVIYITYSSHVKYNAFLMRCFRLFQIIWYGTYFEFTNVKLLTQTILELEEGSWDG